MNNDKFKQFSKLLQEQIEVASRGVPGGSARTLADTVKRNTDTWLDPAGHEVNSQELIKIWTIQRAILYMEQMIEDSLEENKHWIPAGTTTDDYEPAELFKLMLEKGVAPTPEDLIEHVEDGVREELGWAVRHAGNQIIAALGTFTSLDDTRRSEPLLDADSQVFSPAQEKARGSHQAGEWDF